MGLISNIKTWVEELKRVSQQRADEKYDEATFEELKAMGLIDTDGKPEGNVARIVDESCNWEKENGSFVSKEKVDSDKAKREAAKKAAERAAKGQTPQQIKE